MLEDLRALLYRALNTRRGDWLPPVRIQKRILRTVHELLGSPLAPPPPAPAAPAPAARREPAPVMVYWEQDRNVRELTRIKETLEARNISYRLLDVAGDPSTKSFVLQAAGCEEDDLPVVFVAGTVVGTYHQVVQWDVSGRLANEVFGPS